MNRSFHAWVRARIEGLCFAPLLLVLLPAFATCAAVGLLRCSRNPESLAHRIRFARCTPRRWAKFLLFGLDPAREIWWGEFEFERRGVLVRYMAWLELFDLMNLAAGAGQPRQGPEHVLTIQLTHLGDLLLVIPFLRALREQRKDMELDLLTGPWCTPVARKISYVTSAITYVPRLELFNRGDDSACLGCLAEFRFLLGLRRRRYATVFSVSTTRIVELCLIHAAAPLQWVGADDEMPLYGAPCRALKTPYQTRCYEAERVGGLLDLVGLQPPEPRLEFRVDESDRKFARAFLESCGLAASQPLVIVAPGAGWPGKQWPADRFAALADAVSATLGAVTVIAGSRGEKHLAEEVAHGMTSRSIVAAGETTFDQLAALMERAKLFIGNDSGPMHLAAACGIPTVTFFGPTRPEQWAPRGPIHRSLRARTPCDGCIPWHRRAACLHDGRCMKEITEAEALAAANELLAAAALRPERSSRT